MERMTELTPTQGFKAFEESGDLPLQADLGDETLLVADDNGLSLIVGDEWWHLDLSGKTQYFIEVTGRAVHAVLVNSPLNFLHEAGQLGFEELGHELKEL